MDKIWAPSTVITTGGYTRESGMKTAQETGRLIGYGVLFTANVRAPHCFSFAKILLTFCINIQPDLPFRLKKDLPLNKVDLKTLYAKEIEQGYTTYPFSEEYLQEHNSKS